MSEAPNDAPADGGNGAGTPSDWLKTVELPADLTFTHKGEDGKEQILPLGEHPKLKGFKSTAELVKSWFHQEQALGKPKGLQAPGKDATPEQHQAFQAELRKLMGVPDKPEGYELKLPEGAKADENLLTWFKSTALDAGMPPAAAQKFLDSYNVFAAQAWEAMEKQAATAAAEAMTKTFGDADKAAQAVEIAARGFKALAAKAGLPPEVAQHFKEDYGNDPVILQVLKALGDTYREDGHLDGGGGGGPASGKSDAEVFYGPKKT